MVTTASRRHLKGQTCEDEPRCDLGANEARQEVRRSHARVEAETHKRHAELGGLPGDAHVSSESKTEAGPDSRPVYCSKNRDRKFADTEIRLIKPPHDDGIAAAGILGAPV